MKNIGAELFNIIEQKRLVKRAVAKAAGVTPTYLSLIMHKPSIDAELLEKISGAVGVSPAYFFDDFAADGSQAPEMSVKPVLPADVVCVPKKEIEYMHKLIDEKERTIEILMKSKGF